MLATREVTMRIFLLLLVPIVLSVFLCPAQTAAQTSYPMITHTMPVAVQRGRMTEITVEGQMNFTGVYKALFEGSGIAAEVLPLAAPVKNPPVRAVKLRLRVAPDAELGIREFRLASSLG